MQDLSKMSDEDLILSLMDTVNELDTSIIKKDKDIFNKVHMEMKSYQDEISRRLALVPRWQDISTLPKNKTIYLRFKDKENRINIEAVEFAQEASNGWYMDKFNEYKFIKHNGDYDGDYEILENIQPLFWVNCPILCPEDLPLSPTEKD